MAEHKRGYEKVEFEVKDMEIFIQQFAHFHILFWNSLKNGKRLLDKRIKKKKISCMLVHKHVAGKRIYTTFSGQHVDATDATQKVENSKDSCWISRRLLKQATWKFYSSKVLQTAMKEDGILMAVEHFKLYAHTVLCLNTENKTKLFM